MHCFWIRKKNSQTRRETGRAGVGGGAPRPRIVKTGTMRRALAAACRAAAADCGAYDHRCLSTATSTGWLRGAGSGAGAPPQAAAAALARLGSPSGSRGFSAFDEDGDENRDVMGRASDRASLLVALEGTCSYKLLLRRSCMAVLVCSCRTAAGSL